MNKLLPILAILSLNIEIVVASEVFCPDGSNPDPAVIWCDDFEDGLPLTDKYYEFDHDDGDFIRDSADSFQGEYSLRARFQQNEIDAGHFMYNFGRNPIGSQAFTDTDFDEVYWRFYVKLEEGFEGRPDKLTRTTIFAGQSREQAMIAHVWSHYTDREFLLIDPVSGIDSNNNLITTTWNDFENLQWLGSVKGNTRIEAGRWYCLEARVKLNSPGNSDGVLEYWIDGELDAGRSDLNYVGSWNDYGINSVFISNYWNQGSTKDQNRYLDNLVISSKRIGCVDAIVESVPMPPTLLTAN